MLAKSRTCAVIGLDGFVVEVEVDISPGLPSFTIVGLPDTAVQESRERVRAAIRNSGHEFPMRRVTVSLAPADLRKAGPAYDLPIAGRGAPQHGPDTGVSCVCRLPGRAVAGRRRPPHQWHPADGGRCPRRGFQVGLRADSGR